MTGNDASRASLHAERMEVRASVSRARATPHHACSHHEALSYFCLQDGGFTIVSGRRAARGRGGQSSGKKSVTTGFRYSRTAAESDAEAECSALGARVDDAVAELRASGLASGLLHELRAQPALSSIVCLGVGRFGSHRAARYQLALALLLRDELLPSASAEGCECHAHPRLHVYDPLFGDIERRYARLAGCAIRPHNEAGSVRVPDRCLYLLLHCPRALYSNLLAANWGADELQRVVVLGNSFAALADSLDPTERANSASWCRVTRVAHLATEKSCGALGGGDSGAFDHAFANTSLHTFEADAMPPADDAIWTQPFAATPEPSDQGLLSDGCCDGGCC